MPEIGLPDPDGHDQVVVRELDARPPGPGGDDPVGDGIDVDDLGELAPDVALPGEEPPQRNGDLALEKHSGSQLVEQRLEQVVLGAVDQDDLDRRPAQRPGREEPGKSAAYDDHPARLTGRLLPAPLPTSSWCRLYRPSRAPLPGGGAAEPVRPLAPPLESHSARRPRASPGPDDSRRPALRFLESVGETWTATSA